MKYAFCNCDVHLFDQVLYVYAAGDCDTAYIHDFDPTDGFGTVRVHIPSAGVTLGREIVESVVHMNCPETDGDF